MFDILGQMWITVALNTLSVLTSILGIVGIFFRRKTAVIAVSTYTCIGIESVIYKYVDHSILSPKRLKLYGTEYNHTNLSILY